MILLSFYAPLRLWTEDTFYGRATLVLWAGYADVRVFYGRATLVLWAGYASFMGGLRYYESRSPCRPSLSGSIGVKGSR
jgi:hypothetical protein